MTTSVSAPFRSTHLIALGLDSSVEHSGAFLGDLEELLGAGRPGCGNIGP
ncbi:MAG: hypothetical protein ACRDQ4_17075 [Pseudonocardiaceae bacterium]